MKIKEGKQIGFVIKKGINVDKQFQYGKCIFEQGFDSANVGVSEVTLNGTIGKNLKSYTIKGNTVQNGTPTPDNPVEVLGVGDKTTNLLNLSREQTNTFSFDSTKWFISAATVSTISSNASATVSSRSIKVTSFVNGYGACFMVPAFEQFSYSISFDTDKTSSGSYIGYSFRDADGNVLYQSGISEKSATFATYAGTAYIELCFRCTPSDGEVEYSNIMLNEGSTALPYEPYGYKIPVTTRGKNLFDSTTLEGGIYLAANGNKYGVITDGVRSGTKIEVFPNTAYTLSVHSSENVSLRILEWSNGTFTNQTPKYNVSGSVSLTVTTTAETTEIAFNIEGANGQYATSIILNEGSTTLPYEPYREPVVSNVYLDEPLHSGDYIKLNADGSGVVHREWRKYVFDGSENWAVTTSAANLTRAVLNTSTGYIVPNSKVYSTHYQCVAGGGGYPADGTAIVNMYGTLILSAQNVTTIDEWRAYLAAQYAAGTPVTVIYQLATPTDTPITLPDIPTLKALPPLHTYDGATTVISVDTTVSPSKFDAAYKSNVSNSYTIEYHTADNKGFASADGAMFTTRY